MNMGSKDSRPFLTSLLLGLFALGVFFSSATAWGGEVDLGKGSPSSSRVDLSGDPLPAGAVARLGSTRFRFAAGTGDLVFGPEDKTLLAYCGGHLVVWDRATGKQLRRLPVPPELPASFSP